MISQTAQQTVESFERKGLRPSFADIVRLNALGLKLEAARKKNIPDTTYYLPRVAKISESVAFRQPTVGHEIWFDRVERFCQKDDFETALAVKAFGLTRSEKDLPDPDDPKTVKKAVEAFCREMKDFSREQIFAALEYVLYGADPSSGELPAAKEKKEAEAPGDWKECIALGVLNEGRAVLWGITESDMLAMTPEQLRDVIRRSYTLHGLTSSDTLADIAEGDYFATVDEIEKRLKAEKENGK